MKITFIQQSFREQFGIMYLSALLKKAGHITNIFIYSKESIIEILKDKADLYAFSSSTPSWKEDIEIIKTVRAVGKKVIVGGAHATFNPEDVIQHVDILCVGEGYEALLEYVNEPKRRDIKNLWFKVGKTIIKNEIRNIFDINKLPMPDYNLYYDKYSLLKNKSTKQVYIVRGCPFQCSFCYNPVLNKMYHGKGTIIQNMNIDKAMDEIKQLNDKYGFKWLQFISDTMNLNREWFITLIQRIKKEINKPYICNVRVNLLDEELVKIMSETGCNRVDFGVEHGDSFIRNNILNRNMTDKQMIDAGQWFKKYGIRVQTTNIFGLPFENLNSAIKTVELNQKIEPEIAKACVLQPFKGTEVYNYAKDRLLLQNMDDDFGTTFQKDFDKRSGRTKIKLKDEKKIIRLSYLLNLFVQNKWLNNFIKIIVSVNIDRFIKKIYNNTFLKQDKKYQ